MGEARRCPKCGKQHPWIWRPHYPGRENFFNLWYVECWACHYCGKPKLRRINAIKAWNKIRRNEYV